jgi:hypothetical protein
MGAWVVLALSVAALCYWLFSYRRLKKLHGAALAKYNAGAFKEVVEPGPDENFVYVTRLARELESRKGVLAIAMPTPSGGVALHHINKNGTFSSRGPYFVSRLSHNWRLSGRRHLVKVLRGKNGCGFEPDHYNQSGIITERGVAVVEYDTPEYGSLGLYAFVEVQRRAQQIAAADRAKSRAG